MGERTCPLCRSPRVATLFAKRGTDYWACRDCRFRFATPDVNPNFANAIDDYEEAYVQYLAPDAADRSNFDALYRWMAGITPLAGKRLLDVGAGSGKLVRYLRGRGVDAHGIEPSRALFDRFLDGDPAFTCATADAVRGSFGSFAVVTAFDVIEHVADPDAFLHSIVPALHSDGVVFVSTPDVGSVMATLFGRRWHFYYPYHLSYFAPGTLAEAAQRHGLQLIDCCHRGRRRSIGYIVRYAAEFILGGAPPAWAQRFDDWSLQVNLFDTMYVAFRRDRCVDTTTSSRTESAGSHGTTAGKSDIIDLPHPP
jgi:2-polyprenyl-3-methyl-5-hydroxy-6-metoxy-1,4-benzoquinol methylase